MISKASISQKIFKICQKNTPGMMKHCKAANMEKKTLENRPTTHMALPSFIMGVNGN